MNKKEFLQELKNKISILKEEEVNDIINEYSELIDEKLKKKQKEEKIIKDLGNIDDLAKEILDAYKINHNYNKNAGTKFFEQCNKIIETLVNKFKDESFSSIVKFLLEIVVILIFIAILKIPFALVESLGANIFTFSYAPLSETLQTIWNFLIEMTYLVVAILVFVNIFKVKYLDDKKGGSKVTEKKEPKKESKKEIKNEIKEEKEKLTTANDTDKIIFSFFKIIILIMSIPFIFTLIGLCAGIGFIIYVGVMYNWFIGLFLIALALIIGNLWLLEIFYRIIFDKPLKGLKILLTLVFTIIVFVVGICICTIEFNQIKLKSIDPEVNKIKNVTKTVELSPLYRIEINESENTANDTYYIEYDNTLDNEVRIKAEYYDTLGDMEINKKLDGEYEITNKEFSLKYLDSFFENLKNNEILDYSQVGNVKVTLYVNEKDVNKLNLDEDSYYLNGVFHPEIDD